MSRPDENGGTMADTQGPLGADRRRDPMSAFHPKRKVRNDCVSSNLIGSPFDLDHPVPISLDDFPHLHFGSENALPFSAPHKRLPMGSVDPISVFARMGCRGYSGPSARFKIEKLSLASHFPHARRKFPNRGAHGATLWRLSASQSATNVQVSLTLVPT